VSGVVRPVDARVVRQEHAAESVSQMFDARPASGSGAEADGGAPRATDLGAYREPASAFYVYRLRRGDESHVGVVAEVGVEAFWDGQVRGHEAVQPDRVDALVRHFSSAPVHTELVALLHERGQVTEDAVTEAVSGPPLVQFVGPDGWEQSVWPIPRDASPALAHVLSDGALYIADGHHRVSASLRVWHRSGRPSDSGLMCVIYPFGGLRLLAFHRRVAGPVDADTVFKLLAGSFEVRDIEHPDEATGCFGVYVDGRWYDAVHTGTRAPGAAGLDVAVLNQEVLDPLLGPGAVAAARLEIASALTPLDELTGACDEDGGALFALQPPTIEKLTEVADRGEVMPPKTTYFDPKPYAGIFVR
jgi:uncharacterized protein (DUF1015 family)